MRRFSAPFIIFWLLAVSILFQNCGTESPPSVKSTATMVDQTQPNHPMLTTTTNSARPKPPCTEDLNCIHACDVSFAFTTRQEIERDASAHGGVCAGATVKKIAENELSILNHTECLKLFIEEAFEFLDSPLTFDDVEIQVQSCGSVYNF